MEKKRVGRDLVRWMETRRIVPFFSAEPMLVVPGLHMLLVEPLMILNIDSPVQSTSRSCTYAYLHRGV